jgi:mannose-6-phosphate isomerase-like protein (cupin superfamily)
MKTRNLLAVFATTVMLTALAADVSRPNAVIHLDHETVAAAFAKGAPLLATNNFKVQAGRRTEPGEVEVHDSDTDIFYVLEGSATFVTGGKAVGARSIGPGETRAKEIVDGQSTLLKKGDVIVIPNRTPHWFKEVQGPLLYYVVKVAQQPH